MISIDFNKRNEQRIACLLKAIDLSTFSKKPDNEELIQLIRDCADKELCRTFLNAGECFGAAIKIEQEFLGPAILLYVAAVEALVKGPNIELQEQIKKAKLLFKENKLSEDENVRATVEAANERAVFKRTGCFLRAEFKDGLRRANYPEESSAEFAKRIVEASNEVRHKAKMDQINTDILVIRGDVRKPVLGIFQPKLSEFRRLIKPARLGSANAIAKHVLNRTKGQEK